MNTAREDMYTGIFAGLLDFDNEGCLSIILMLLQRRLVSPTSLINYSGTIQIIVCCYFNIIVHINNIVSRESDLIYLHKATLSRFGSLGFRLTGPFESNVSVVQNMSELLPTLSSITSQEKCFVHVGTLLVNHPSAIALPLFAFLLRIRAGRCFRTLRRANVSSFRAFV